MSIDDSLRRIANQAFFERIHIYEVTPHTDAASADHGEPFDILFNPELQAVAVDQDARLQAGLPIDPLQVKGLNIEH